MKNKKYMKIIFIIVGIMLISAASIILIKSAADGRDWKIVADDSELEDGTLTEEECTEILLKLMDYRDEKKPSYYAGEYRKNGYVVIMVSKKDSSLLSDLEEIVGQKESVAIRVVEYSLNDLEEANNAFTKKFDEILAGQEEELMQLTSDLTTWGVKMKNNIVEVGISQITDEKVKRFEEVFGKDERIRYVEGHNLMDL